MPRWARVEQPLCLYVGRPPSNRHQNPSRKNRNKRSRSRRAKATAEVGADKLFRV